MALVWVKLFGDASCSDGCSVVIFVGVVGVAVAVAVAVAPVGVAAIAVDVVTGGLTGRMAISIGWFVGMVVMVVVWMNWIVEQLWAVTMIEWAIGLN